MNAGRRYVDYSPIGARKPLRWPNGARIAVWVIPNIEHFLPGIPSLSISPALVGMVPDVANSSWRDYGMRVGVWRLMEILEKHGVKATAALNSDVCEHYPQILTEGQRLGWEWMGHGRNMASLLVGLDKEQETAEIRHVLDTIERASGARPKGWLSPAVSESFNTPDVLAHLGVEYVGDWFNDDQPCPLRVASNALLSLPYSPEINDVTHFLVRQQTPEAFYQAIVDQFDVLYAEGATSGRVMGISLHTFICGQAFRSRYVDRALEYIRSHEQVWFATGSEIAAWYRHNYLQGFAGES
jgi:allantoinase